ncbi:PLC-like phosphodiesterase, TIM beta/alpha-barrel-containing domain containing protein [Elaphomyces granulatus]
MGEGGYLSLINATPYTWHNLYQHSYQLNTWKFPDTVNPGQLAQVYVELGGGTLGDDAGEVNYSVVDPSTTAFQVQLRVVNNVATSNVYLQGIETSVNHIGDTISVGFSHNIATPVIIAGSKGDFTTNSVPTDWMHSNLDSFGCQSLRHLCMPASHDAGMSTLDGKTALANTQNTVTQNLDIADQLTWGARYFDIRPVIGGGIFKTGHYSKVACCWDGGNGQTIDDVISQVNGFLAKYQELVILDLSHALDSDTGYNELTQDEWNQLIQKLLALNHRFVAPPNTSDLSLLTLRDFIGTGPAVVVIFDQDAQKVNLGSYQGQGFYSSSEFSVYNSYSDTDNADKMISDQLGKLKAQRPNPDSGLFLLSWTLTQQAGTSLGIVGKSIIDLAQQVFPRLFNSNSLWDAMSSNTYPNFIMIDAWSPDTRLAAFVVAINKQFTKGC